MRPAVDADVDQVMLLRAGAARWLHERGCGQWQSPWPSEQGMRDTILGSIRAGQTWMATGVGGRTVGTVALDGHTAPGLWTPGEEAEPCRYVHRLIIDRAVAGHGVGAWILDWAAGRARAQGARWLRADVWTDNVGLHRYYLQRGWRHVRTVVGEYPSGALFQLRL